MSTPDPLRAVTDPRLRRFYDYLERKRAGRPFLRRRDIDPIEFPYVLGNLMLIDVLYQPLRFRYRLVGANLVGHIGYDMTGKFVEDHPEPARRAFAEESYRMTVATGRVSAGVFELLVEQRPIRFQAFRFPLSDDAVSINMILVAFARERAEVAREAAGRRR
jgi:hypothetical protein